MLGKVLKLFQALDSLAVDLYVYILNLDEMPSNQAPHPIPSCLHTLNDFKNAPLLKNFCRRINKVINYTYVTDQLLKLCSHNL